MRNTKRNNKTELEKLDKKQTRAKQVKQKNAGKITSPKSLKRKPSTRKTKPTVTVNKKTVTIKEVANANS